MANESEDALTTGVLMLGGGAAGYALSRWVVAPWLDRKRSEPTPASSPVASTTSSATSSASAATPTATSPAKPSSPSPTVASPTTKPGGPTATRPTKPRSHAGPPIGAKPIDPYAETGPITKPSQLDSRALGAELAAALVGPPADAKPIDPYAGVIEMPAMFVGRVVSPRTRRFDAVFERYRGAIPIEYLRALVERESSGHPLARTGSAYGLMQIVPVVREDYNKRHGTPYQPEHLYDPTINVGIGCELLRIIITNYRRYHPRVPNLQTNWDNERFVELVTFGWNAGFSEAGGVGRVATYLEKLGAIDITMDLVHDHARTAGASKHLSNPAKVRWCKSVVALYLRERAAARTTNLS